MNPPRRRHLGWLALIGAWTAFGVGHAVLWMLTARDPMVEWRWVLPISLALAWFWAAITPAVFALARWAAPSRKGWVVAIGGHLIAAVAVVLAVAMMRHSLIYALSPFKGGVYLATVFYWADVYLLTYLALVGVGRALDLHRRYVDRALRAHLLEVQLTRAQMQYLELQLQPHFLFNSLNAIQELAHETPDAAERMLRRLHRLLAISLERSGRDEVTLDEELSALEPYLDIQRTRFSESLRVDLRIAPAARDALVPHLILQPLVENAIRHGLSVLSSQGIIEVSAEIHHDRLRLRVRDNGVGVAASRSPRQGIGLRNASERLRQLYGSAHRFELREAPGGGALVELELPFRRSGPGVSSTLSDTAERALRPRDTAELPIEDLTVFRTGEFSSAVAASLTTTDTPPPPRVSPPPADWQPSGSWRSPGDLRGAAAGTRAGAGGVVPNDNAPALSMRTWVVLLLLWALGAAFWTEQIYFFARARDGEGALDLRENATIQAVSALIWAIFTPVVLWLSRRLRVERIRWRSRLSMHTAFALAFGVMHIGLLRVVGLVDTPLFSPYDLNPLTGDLFIYFLLVTWSHSRDFIWWYRAREIEAARLAAEVARSRFQALCVQLRPQFLLSTLELLAALVHTDVPRAERLIARLADVLRLTLDMAGERMTTLRQEMVLLTACVEAHRLGIRPGVRLETRIEPEALGVSVPSRLVCTMVDDLLAADGGSGSAPLVVQVQAERGVGTTRVRLRGTGALRAAPTELHSWWRKKSVAEAAVMEAGPLVSLTFPDPVTAVLIVEDDGAVEAVDATSGPRLEAQPA